MGFTKIVPGQATFDSIGVRYSGKYKILTVTHILEGNSYTTKGTAISESLASGGVKIPEAEKVKDREEQETFRLFEEETSTPGVANQSLDKLNKLRESK